MGAPVPRIMPIPRMVNLPSYKFLFTEERNNTKWYFVRIYKVEAVEWLKSQPQSDWLMQRGRHDKDIQEKRYMMCEQLYMIFKLRWS